MLSIIYKAFLAILAASAMFANGPQPVESKAMEVCPSGWQLMTLRDFENQSKLVLKCVYMDQEQFKKGIYTTCEPIGLV